MTQVKTDDAQGDVPVAFSRADHVPARTRLAHNLLNTIPIVLVGSIAVGLGLTGPVSHEAKRVDETKSPDSTRPDGASASSVRHTSDLGRSIRASLTAAHINSTIEATTAGSLTVAAIAPAIYTVATGDTVSGIAGRFGLATASVLALNGLGWKSVIFPGQKLTLTKTAAPVSQTPTRSQAPNSNGASSGGHYTIVSGDTITAIAARFGLSTAALLSANGLTLSSTIYSGRPLVIPGITTVASVSSAPIAATPTRVGNTSHVIVTGETVASIAADYAVSIQALLSANGLGWSSIIYSGRTLIVPGVPVVGAPASGSTALTAQMATNAKTIIRVGKSLKVGNYGLVIALAAAMQESSLQNLNYGDLDSLGLFQQRPSAGWGTPSQVTDPVHAAKLFFGGATGPNRGVTNGLLDIRGWQSMTLTQAAQAVQNSAYPDAYAKWEKSAWTWLDQLT